MLDDNHAEASIGTGMGGGKLALERKDGVCCASVRYRPG